MKNVLLVMLFFMLVSVDNNQQGYSDYKRRAKIKADSIIGTIVDKARFNKYYHFDSKNSFVTLSDGTRRSWNENLDMCPNSYFLNFSYQTELAFYEPSAWITLDSSLKLADVEDLIDSKFLKATISTKRIKEIKSKFPWQSGAKETFIYDSITGKVTSKPYLKISYYIRTVDSTETGQYPCLYNIDTCFKVDLFSGKIISTFNQSRDDCF